MISMRIKNVNPKGWYDIPDYDGLYQINYWGNVRKRLKYGCYKQLHPYVKKSRKGKRFIKLCGKEWVVMSLMRITYMCYQTVLDYVNGKMKGIYAPDGYAYCKDTDDEITKLIRRIEISNKAECGVNFTQAPAVVFDF